MNVTWIVLLIVLGVVVLFGFVVVHVMLIFFFRNERHDTIDERRRLDDLYPPAKPPSGQIMEGRTLQSGELERQVRSLLAQGRKIEAVKFYRDHTGASLAAAKDVVEAMQAVAATPSRLGGDEEAELLWLLRQGQKLEAIKLYRDRKGVALLEAKQAVESLAMKHRIGDR